MYCQTIRLVRDIYRDDRTRIVTCTSRTLTDRHKENFSIDGAVVPDTCSKPREAGPCHTYKLQWYHDAHQEKCTQFVYSGCGGNDNNFKTEDECERRCGQVQPTTTDATTAAVTTVVEVVQGQLVSVLRSRVEMGKGNVIPQAVCLSTREG